MEVINYLIKNKNHRINSNHIDDYTDLFIDINHFKKEDCKSLDYDYLEGAIVMEYNGKAIMGYEHWDLIEPLWWYFIDAIDKLQTDVVTDFTFPDQPLKVIMRKEDGWIILSLDNKKIKIPMKEFVTGMLASARNFYDRLIFLFPESTRNAKYFQNKINKILY